MRLGPTFTRILRMTTTTTAASGVLPRTRVSTCSHRHKTRTDTRNADSGGQLRTAADSSGQRQKRRSGTASRLLRLLQEQRRSARRARVARTRARDDAADGSAEIDATRRARGDSAQTLPPAAASVRATERRPACTCRTH
ncbi:hypothetical protein N1851_018554 [Merluccius polli]|uniref:Uncharacterized protein n=1 Tax=Merluccius polli TaxID=89951 RepID=A0AA47P190_MERPO|nr:hypothetical protein N1851_018554 [Merluccius polli]